MNTTGCVYIREGCLSDPVSVILCDAATDVQLADVAGAQITLDANLKTTISLLKLDGTTEHHELVRAPSSPAQLPDQQLVYAPRASVVTDLALDQMKLDVQFRAYRQVGTTLKRESGEDIIIRQSCANSALQMAVAPNALWKSLWEQMGQSIGKSILTKMMGLIGLAWDKPSELWEHHGREQLGLRIFPSKAKTGVRINPDPDFYVRGTDPTSILKSLDDCEECKGTGEYTCPITAKKSPCSKGCKP